MVAHEGLEHLLLSVRSVCHSCIGRCRGHAGWLAELGRGQLLVVSCPVLLLLLLGLLLLSLGLLIESAGEGHSLLCNVLLAVDHTHRRIEAHSGHVRPSAHCSRCIELLLLVHITRLIAVMLRRLLCHWPILVCEMYTPFRHLLRLALGQTRYLTMLMLVEEGACSGYLCVGMVADR